MNHCEGLGGVGVIELKRIRPTRIMRISSEREDLPTREASPSQRIFFDIGVGPFNQKIRTISDPGVIETYVVRYKIKEEIYPSLL